MTEPTEFEATFMEGETPPATNPAEAMRETRAATEKLGSDEFAAAWDAEPATSEGGAQ